MTPRSLAWGKKGVAIHQGRKAGEEGMGGSLALDMLCKTCPIDLGVNSLIDMHGHLLPSGEGSAQLGHAHLKEKSPG